jgi:hypothetical protein
MAFELRELQGNAFNNKHKKSDRAPDMRGEFLLNGVPHEIAIWHKNGQNGPFIGFKISEKQERQEMVSTGRHSFTPGGKVKREDPISTGRNDDMSDEIPW